MTTTIFIPINERNAKRNLIEEISEVVFGNEEQANFAEEFVPVRCRVPNPKTTFFTNFLIKGPRLLWAIQYNGKTVGFILIGDSPHNNAIGFSINSEYSNKKITSDAFEMIRHHGEIAYPLYGYTSTRNVSAQRFMEKVGFLRQPNTVDFCGEDSFQYKLER